MVGGTSGILGSRIWSDFCLRLRTRLLSANNVWIAPKSADLTQALVNFVRDQYLHVAFAAHFHLKAEPFRKWKQPVVRSIKQTYWINLNSNKTTVFREVDSGLQSESKTYRKLVEFFEDPDSKLSSKIKEDFLLYGDFRGLF